MDYLSIREINCILNISFSNNNFLDIGSHWLFIGRHPVSTFLSYVWVSNNTTYQNNTKYISISKASWVLGTNAWLANI